MKSETMSWFIHRSYYVIPSKTKGDTCSFNIEMINRSNEAVKFRKFEILESDFSQKYNEELPFNQVVNIKING